MQCNAEKKWYWERLAKANTWQSKCWLNLIRFVEFSGVWIVNQSTPQSSSNRIKRILSTTRKRQNRLNMIFTDNWKVNKELPFELWACPLIAAEWENACKYGTFYSTVQTSTMAVRLYLISWYLWWRMSRPLQKEHYSYGQWHCKVDCMVWEHCETWRQPLNDSK